MSLSGKSCIPNLFIIGAMKSGTTSLHEYLNSHPDIFMSKVKEPGYFSKCVNYYPKDSAWYMSLFADVKDEVIVGESSTHYTKLPTCDDVVDRLWKFNPDARFIYVMRHPVKRVISHYWHNIKNGEEYRDILSAIDANEEYISFSDYAYQLEPYIARFGMEKMYTLTFEDLINDPDKELKNIFSWLGVDNTFVVGASHETYNALPETFKKVRGRGLLYSLRSSVLWNSLSPLVPKVITRYAASMTEQDVVKSTDDSVQATKVLTPVLAEKVRVLEKLLDKELDVWKI